MPKITLVLNEPPPYRIPVLNRIAAYADIQLQVIFCCRREPNRHWDLPPMAFVPVYLRERITTIDGRYIHNNPDVLLALARFSPDVVVGNGFNPTHLYAMVWCALRRRPYVPMTDGTLTSERVLSGLHLAVRRFVYRRACAFIAASQGGITLYRHYGVPLQHCHLSCLCIDNSRYRPNSPSSPPFDFVFCGRLEEGKNPAFAIDVAARCAQQLQRRIRLLFVGSGSLEADLRYRAAAVANQVDTHFHGFAAQAELPSLYQSARIFLFPTRADVWGVVANEACAAGLPVIVSPHAGVADELVVDGHNGFVLPLDVDTWAEATAMLIADEPRRLAFGQRAMLKVAPYCFERAAQGIVDACNAALARSARSAAATRRLIRE
jgi:glycosyltransferase involved in cell wall biosynthesis